jgi:hypothetical protein
VSPGLRAARLVVRCAASVLPDREQRDRYSEQWQADVDGAAEFGLSPVRLALGAAGAAVRISVTSTKGSASMLPIGPLAIALKVVGGSRARQRAAALAVVFTLTLLGGVALLIAR